MPIEHESDEARKLGERLHESLVEVSWEDELARLRRGHEYRGATHSATTVAKRQGLRVVIVAIKAGGEMPPHRTGSPITVQCLSGHGRMTVGDRVCELKAGQILVLAEALQHSVQGVEESAFLLTIGGLSDGRDQRA